MWFIFRQLLICGMAIKGKFRQFVNWLCVMYVYYMYSYCYICCAVFEID
ncbi:hypothetical protein JGI16_11691, partial [Candidatus Kryptonium thompsonii]